MRNPFKRQKSLKEKVGIVLTDANDRIICPGYTALDHCPEVMTAVQRIAEIIGSMTIHLMANTANGDQRIVNELSRMIDITPMPNMTRSTWMESIVTTMLLPGQGNAIVLPHTHDGYLERLEPVAASRVTFSPIGYTDYNVLIDGKVYRPDDVLHFTYNPDPIYLWKGRGPQVSLRDVCSNLKQAAATRKGFLESKWKPSVIVKVDAMTEELATPAGRKKIQQDFIDTDTAGEPWIIPGEQVSVETVKPLTLSDLAINDSVEIDKRTVAAVFGEPAFVLGVGDYDQKAWNNFVETKIRTICLNIAQEMTRKLILSPQWYLKFNVLSLMDWDIQTIANVMCTYGDRGYVDGNEARDRIGLSPREGLDELRILENYIPAAMSGAQSKLVGNDNKEEE